MSDSVATVDPAGKLLSAVIPVYCEGEHIRSSLRAIGACMAETECRYEIIVVDDGSHDGTWHEVVEAVRADARVRAYRLSRNFGKEAALSAGLERARGDAVVVLDADLQHPPEIIREMVKIWRESKVQIVSGKKRQRGDEPLARRIGAKVTSSLLSRLSGFDLTGATDFKLMDRCVVNAWLSLPERRTFFRGMVSWLGFRHSEIEFDVTDGVSRESRWSTSKLMRLALTAITTFSAAPLHLVSAMGLMFLLFAVVLGAWTFWMWAAGQAVSGFTTVILLQLMIGSCLALGLGIIGEYLATVYFEIKGRPRYVISETFGAADAQLSGNPSPSLDRGSGLP